MEKGAIFGSREDEINIDPESYAWLDGLLIMMYRSQSLFPTLDINPSYENFITRNLWDIMSMEGEWYIEDFASFHSLEIAIILWGDFGEDNIDFSRCLGVFSPIKVLKPRYW